MALLKFIYVRVFTTMAPGTGFRLENRAEVTTNWIMEAVFDAADDTLKVSKESGRGPCFRSFWRFRRHLKGFKGYWHWKVEMWRLEQKKRLCAGKHVEESWAKLTQNKRKKKKKKRKKDEETEEEGYEEGWYYEEGVGEVPDLPPAAPQGVEPSAAADPAAPAADPAVPAGVAHGKVN